MSKTVSAKSANNGNAIEFASDAGAVRFARCIRSGGYVRVLRGAAADADWWERLRPDERYFFRCVMQAKLRPELVLTKLSAAAVYGARLRVEPQKVLCAAAPGADPSRIMLGRTKSTPLPAGVKLVYQSVTVQPDGSYTVGKAMKPSRAKKDGESGGRGTNGMDGADGTGNSPSERTRRSGTSVVVACTSLTRTIYDIAAAYPLEDSMIVINSLLSERASKHRVLAKENRLSEKGALCAHLCRMAVSDMLGAKSYAAFREAAEPYRQHGLKYEYAAALLEDCLGLVWENRGKHGVRQALLALLLASDKCESAGESLSCVRFFELGLVQPYLQMDFFDKKSGRQVYRVDGAWDLRKAGSASTASTTSTTSKTDKNGTRGTANKHGKRGGRTPFVREIEFGVIGAPGSRQALLFEFDGKIKYEDPVILAGRTKEAVLEEQNEREEALRAMGYEMVRIVWADLTRPASLARKLSRFAIPHLKRDKSAKKM